MKRDVIKQNTSIVVSILACAFGLLALCLVRTNTEYDRNLQSMLIGVLGTITTVLIGWQIITIFNLNWTVKNINISVNKKIIEAIEAFRIPLEGEIAYIRADRWRRQGINSNDNMAFALAYDCYLVALECFIKYPKQDSHEELLEYLKDVIESEGVSEWLSEDERGKGIEVISKAQSDNKNEVLRILLTIEIKS